MGIGMNRMGIKGKRLNVGNGREREVHMWVGRLKWVSREVSGR